ncbi:NADH dehydrogenase [ubiquinone] 1 subunit C2 [Austrofundulus limnaeus]|uniref:NADH dehydrogenase [ubiquinone] 1 subunit C2 n=1 Tax=Austrofundulus limnaeus TaxID=52670 RepID=A0A2I4BKF8_AUSLI|nr:PREDICTED: NADH dehydrogenase [ubiquinone] 1 subunit C2-like [Austrofundulus limnaeus]
MDLPEEAKVLPPPSLFNMHTAYFGFLGWFTAIMDNAFRQRPPLRAGVHRQVLLTTICWCYGYHHVKRANYIGAKRDRDISGYIKLHPDRFPQKEKKTFAEIVEPFFPIR